MADADRPFAVPPVFCRIWRQLLRISLKSTKKRQKRGTALYTKAAMGYSHMAF